MIVWFEEEELLTYFFFQWWSLNWKKPWHIVKTEHPAAFIVMDGFHNMKRALFLSLINSPVEKGINEIFCSCHKRIGRLGNFQLPVKKRDGFPRSGWNPEEPRTGQSVQETEERLEISHQTSTSSLFRFHLFMRIRSADLEKDSSRDYSME